MIIYGTKATLLKTEHVLQKCLSCSNPTLYINVYSRYAHIFWIPFFPIGKTGVSVCTNCKQTLKLKEMPESYKIDYENIKGQTKIPIWHFSGLFIIAIGSVALFYSDKQKKERIGKYVLAPKTNDIFEIRLKDDAFTTLKVKRVAGDTVYFVANKYQTNQLSGLSDLSKKGDSDYETELTGILKATLINMNTKDEIIDIDRD